MSRGWNAAEALGKIDYEGGLHEAIEWGLTPDDFEDPELAEMFKPIYNLTLEAIAASRMFMSVLESEAEKYPSEDEY